MSKELILKLRYIALCADRADVRETVGQAADALEDKAAPAGEPDCDRSACGDFSPGPCDNPDCPALRSNKAAPVGELNIYAAAKTLAECMDYPWEYMPLQGRDNMRKHAQAVIEAAGAAYQRAQQPQSAEAVSAQVRFRRPEKGRPAWSVWQQTSIKPNMPAWSIDSVGYEVEYRLLYTTPQPSAGVVMPESVGVLILGGLFHGGSGPELGDVDIEPNMRVLERIQMELVTSSDDVHLELFARLNGKEVGRG